MEEDDRLGNIKPHKRAKRDVLKVIVSERTAYVVLYLLFKYCLFSLMSLPQLINATDLKCTNNNDIPAATITLNFSYFCIY